MESSIKYPNTSRKRFGPGSPDLKQSLYHCEFNNDNPFYNTNMADDNYDKKRGPLRAKTDGAPGMITEELWNNKSHAESVSSNEMTM